MAKYHYIDSRGQQQGPYSVDELNDLRVIHFDTPVWCDSMTDWAKADTVEELRPILILQTPPFNGGAGKRQPAPGPKPDSWLAWSILTLILCCQPFAIVGIVFAAKVDGLWSEGRYEEAYDAAKNARLWTIIGMVVGVACAILYGMFVAMGVMAGLGDYTP